MGVIYVKEDQYSEEQILDNNDNSMLFDEFLTLLGDRVRLRGFDKYKGGLDTVHDLTGKFGARMFYQEIEAGTQGSSNENTLKREWNNGREMITSTAGSKMLPLRQKL